MRRKERSTSKFLGLFTLAVFLFFGTFAEPQAAQKFQIGVATSNVGGSWYLLGAGMVPLFAKYAPEIQITTMPGSGGENLRFVSMGRVETGFTTASSAYYGFRQEEFFKDLTTGKNVMGMFGAHGMFVNIVVREDSGIKKIGDLKGKRIAMGPAGSGTNANAQIILKVYGMEVKKDYSPQWVSHGDGSRGVADRLTDCQFFVAGIPAADMMNLSTSTKVRFLDIDEEHLNKILKEYPFFYKYTLAAKTYKGQDKPIVGVGENTVFIVNKNVPDEVVYKMLKVIYERTDELIAVHPGAKEFTHENAKRGLTIPFHPGAIKYFKEVGVWK